MDLLLGSGTRWDLNENGQVVRASGPAWTILATRRAMPRRRSSRSARHLQVAAQTPPTVTTLLPPARAQPGGSSAWLGPGLAVMNEAGAAVRVRAAVSERPGGLREVDRASRTARSA